ncbi:hypothetical protein Fmac_007018 [Flemingia macrophylla]|uniref:FAF domain-containing protein n=1 Tax=Flemingia macrophylla TaxID=520843 RepID=A0ABD1NC88_9FABA
MTNATFLSSSLHPFLFFPSLLLFPAIMFFKRNTASTHTHNHNLIGLDLGLGLGLATREVFRPPHVLESAMLRPISAPTPHNHSRSLLIGSAVNGLTSCTESLGFESSDDIQSDDNAAARSRGHEIWRRKAERRGKVRRSLPPPLKSLSRDGKPSFYLQPVRKDGRLELTEVRIERKEILRASRHNGRLTLHLVADLEDVDEEESEEMETETETETEEDRVRVEEWKFPAVEGVRRCHEMVVNQHHPHAMCGISIV